MAYVERAHGRGPGPPSLPDVPERGDPPGRRERQPAAPLDSLRDAYSSIASGTFQVHKERVHLLPLFESAKLLVEDADRRAIQGAELGLPIAKSIVDRHGGTIRCSSSPGAGTTVRVELPMVSTGRKAS